jgi:hypothetical protein
VILTARRPYCGPITWDLEEYFNDHDIPYRIEPIKEIVTAYYTEFYDRTTVFDPRKHVRKNLSLLMYYGSQDYRTDGCIQLNDAYRFRLIEPVVKPYETFRIVAYDITWWGKDIGIEYLLRSL